jgi:hypothetical protein
MKLSNIYIRQFSFKQRYFEMIVSNASVSAVPLSAHTTQALATKAGIRYYRV